MSEIETPKIETSLKKVNDSDNKRTQIIPIVVKIVK